MAQRFRRSCEPQARRNVKPSPISVSLNRLVWQSRLIVMSTSKVFTSNWIFCHLIRPFVNQQYFIDYGTDASWDGLDKPLLCERKQADFLAAVWSQFGCFQAHYKAWYTLIENINKDRANIIMENKRMDERG